MCQMIGRFAGVSFKLAHSLTRAGRLLKERLPQSCLGATVELHSLKIEALAHVCLLEQMQVSAERAVGGTGIGVGEKDLLNQAWWGGWREAIDIHPGLK